MAPAVRERSPPPASARRRRDARARLPGRRAGRNRGRSCGRCARRSSGSTGEPPSSRRALSGAVGEAELVARTGLNPDASHTAPKAMWLRDEEPENYRGARWLAPSAGHLNGWLTGEVVQDHANASCTLLYELALAELVDDLAGRPAGLDAEQLPPIRPARGRRPAPAQAADASGCRPAAGSPSAPATSTPPRSAPAPWLPASWST